MERAWTPQSVADEMKSAQDACRQIEPFTGQLHGFDSASAYEVARLIHERRVAEGAVPVGRKIGFTNRTIWAEYGVYEPIWAYVLRSYGHSFSELDRHCRARSLCRSAHRTGDRPALQITAARDG